MSRLLKKFSKSIKSEITHEQDVSLTHPLLTVEEMKELNRMLKNIKPKER